MIEVVKALAVATVVGAVLALLRLPVPAPPSWAGVAGVAGLFLGWAIVGRYVGG